MNQGLVLLFSFLLLEGCFLRGSLTVCPEKKMNDTKLTYFRWIKRDKEDKRTQPIMTWTEETSII